MQIVGARALADLRRDLFTFLQSLRLGYFDNQLVGRLVSRVTNDVDAILEAFASGAINGIGDMIRLIGIVIMMVALDWKLSLIGFAALPPVALLVLFVRKRMRETFRDIRPAATMVVCGLATPEMKLEIEVDARIGAYQS